MLASALLVTLVGLFCYMPLSTVAMAPMNMTTHNNSTTDMSNTDSNWSQPAAPAPGAQVPGDMSSGKCMCPAPVTCPTVDPKEPTPNAGDDTPDQPPVHTQSPPSQSPKTDTTGNGTTPNSPTPPTAPTGDNNSTTSDASMTKKSPLYAGLGLVAIASLVV